MLASNATAMTMARRTARHAPCPPWCLALCVAVAVVAVCAGPACAALPNAPGADARSATLPRQLSGYADGGVRRIEFEVPAGRDPVAVTTRVCARYAVEPSECQSVLAGVMDVHDADQVRTAAGYAVCGM